MFVLHAHLPYVRHLAGEDRLEERWLYEALLETYLPLLDMFKTLQSDGIPFRLTMTLSPTLLAMLSDRLLMGKFESYMRKLAELAEKERQRLINNDPARCIAEMYVERLERMQNLYRSCHGDVIGEYRRLQDDGNLEIITCAATHSYLPLLKREESMRAQIAAAVEDYRRHFGRAPRGIWLPECGYTPAAGRILREFGLRFTFADSHALQHAWPQPPGGLHAPVRTPDGITVFARDSSCSRQVWSSREGYPGDGAYREYYRDIGWDLGWHDAEEWEYIRPHLLPDGNRVSTGMKYYRIGEKDGDKQLYHPQQARDKAAEHAAHFIESRERQLMDAHDQDDQNPAPVIVAPYDAELFGHWWFEGPVWLEQVIRRLNVTDTAPLQAKLNWILPSDYLSRFPEIAEAHLPATSWGDGGYGRVWLQPGNDWIYRSLHSAEDRMVQEIQRHLISDSTGQLQISERLLNQAARQLLLAQSSDWPFILAAQTVSSYASERVREHVGHFHRLLDLLQSRTPADLEWVNGIEQRYPCFPGLHYSMFLPKRDGSRSQPLLPGNTSAPHKPAADRSVAKPSRILMLAWEYPPNVIGGLARAVCDLSVQLAAQAHTVHVITRHTPGLPEYELADGVHVHRAKLLQSVTQVPFADWVFQMNLAFADCAVDMLRNGIGFDVIHAHDWLVGSAAVELKQSTGLPLIVTIHATEHGRTGGRLDNELQRRIHLQERRLTGTADRVIVCSRYMAAEIAHLFDVPESKLRIVPNGVDLVAFATAVEAEPTQLSALRSTEEKIIFTIGRLVREKGFQTLIAAMPAIWSRCPEANLVIAGAGPMQDELRKQAEPYGDRIRFTGFLADDAKRAYYRQAAVCVFPSHYEPFGIVALEAFASGTPVVAGHTGGLAEIIEDGVDGCLFPPGCPEQLAERILQLLMNPGTAQALAARAYRKAAQQYDWRTIAAAAARVYQTVAKEVIECPGIKSSETANF